LSCGYTGPVSIHRKEDIVRSVVLHSTVRLLSMLQQISSGMKLYNLLSMDQQEKDICRHEFMSPVFSEMGTIRHQRESIVVNFLQDFKQDMEDEVLPVARQFHIPLSRAEREDFKIAMEFDHDCQVRYGANHTICYPVINACLLNDIPSCTPEYICIFQNCTLSGHCPWL
uniref:Uncharacterized protein n=1 Tax=Sparus aurata TaxID=8175 RepID=A0A671WVM6_SPAAU